jgi:hypothetical protein
MVDHRKYNETVFKEFLNPARFAHISGASKYIRSAQNLIPLAPLVQGISVTTTPGRRTHSQLSIKKADVSDSGNYTRAPSSALPASIHVFVSGSEVKPWTSGANGIKFCADLIYLLAPLMCANLAGFKNSLKTVSLYFLWSTMFTKS